MKTLDPFGIGQATLDVWRAMVAEPEKLLESQQRFAQMWVDLMTKTAAPPENGGSPAIVEPEPGDRRFANEAWTKNPALNAIKQAYLLVGQAFLEAIDRTDVDPKVKRRARFFAKQFIDMMSPTNVPWLNPEVMESMVRTGGQSLVEGWKHALEDATENEGRVALVDTTAFELGKNVATAPGKVVYRNRLMELIRYESTTDTVYERPLLVVPPWINKFYILDLRTTNSFVGHATDAGFQTFVISWKNPDASMTDVRMSDYVREGALEAARVACEIAGTREITMNGYCIGGTLLAMLLAYLARKEPGKRDPVITAATFMASLVDFSEPGEIINFLGDDALEYIESRMKERGYLEGREMADTFNMLRANDLIWTPAVNRYLLGKDAPAFDLLYWNNDATRMPFAMHSYYLRHMYMQNELVKPDALKVKGVKLDLRTIQTPAYVIATRDDHIAPWRSVYAMTQILPGPVIFRLANSGHIAGIINPPGSKKAEYFANDQNPPDPEEWLRAATTRSGSWWPDWYEWLGARSGERVAPPGLPKKYSSLGPAPGTYVLEK